MLKIRHFRDMEYRGVIIELIKIMQPQVYMELGTKKGYTFNTIAPLVDLAIGVDMSGDKYIIKRPNVEFYTMKTDDFSLQCADILKGKKIDFLFIDACHEKSQVKKDFDNFTPFVEDGTGIIFLHDTHPNMESLINPGYCWDAYEFAWELRTNDEYRKHFEICTLPCWTGMSIVRKSDKQLSWK